MKALEAAVALMRVDSAGPLANQAALSGANQTVLKNEVYALLYEYFSDEELAGLCFFMGIDTGELGQGGKASQAQRLIETVWNQQLQGAFVWKLSQLRPTISWPNVGR